MTSFIGALGAGLILAPALAGVCAESDSAQTGAQVGPIEEVVVVGTRRAGLAAIESKSPVTVVGGERLREQGSTDMLEVLHPRWRRSA